MFDTVAGWMKSIEEARASEEAVILGVKRFLQLDGRSCGAQSAFMILGYFGRARSLVAVARTFGTNENGTSTGSLLRLFRQRGLKPVIKDDATVHQLRCGMSLGAPSVVALDGDHWGVVYGYSPTKVYLADPSLRRSIRVGLSLERFQRRWDRWAMIVSSQSRR